MNRDFSDAVPLLPVFFLIFISPDRPLQIIPVQEAIGSQNGCRATDWVRPALGNDLKLPESDIVVVTGKSCG